MSAAVTRTDLLDFLQEQLPGTPATELARVATALALVMKAGRIAMQAAPKPKKRTYTDKSVAASMRLKS